MALFQRAILKNQITIRLDKIKEAYKKHVAYFHNPEIQNSISNINEEEFKVLFLNELFVKVLGYTLKPNLQYNLVLEKKNENDAEKADSAIIIDREVRAVIELKHMGTKDLKQIQKQAFNYKNNQLNATYVITSNFEKLRFYIDNAVDYEEFNLFTLTEDEFAVLWICLSYENIYKDLPKQLKNESIDKESQITKQLYKDYSTFKQALFDNIQKNNPSFDKLELFRKTQKLLDRFLFVFFAEDKNLIPPNSIKRIIDFWVTCSENPHTIKQPLYKHFISYFKCMNEGYKGKTEDIFAYNGGLFKPDETLEIVAIDDVVLMNPLLKLAAYDFDTEVDVNILGHIFEHSLNEIEEITNEITTGEKQNSKRKKDGVFYTPKYITTYIVENTLGKLCADKKVELEIEESDYTIDKNRQNSITKKLEQKLLDYRNWILSLTICDPACGSGAFLNAAHDFLLSEHHLIEELRAKIHGTAYQMFDNIENTILENNLFGVDINEESVEIAKLALWLRTARPNRKLNSLNDNIKCGNSLISDLEVAGEKAFDWHKEFPQVFEKGGFDVVIGNPPYVFAREKVSDFEKEYYTKHYQSAKYQINTYILFMEKAFLLTKKNGLFGLIIPDSWLMIYSGEDLRRFMMENCKLNQIVSLSGKSFEDANVETVIMIAENKLCDLNHETIILKNDETTSSFLTLHTKRQIDFNENKGIEFNVFANNESTRIIEKMKNGSKILDEVCSVKAGLQAYEKGKGIPAQTAVDVKNRPYDYDYQYNQDTYKYLEGSDVLRYGISWSGSWLWYGSHLAAPRTFDLFSDEKIIVREITGKYPYCIVATYSDEIYLYNRSNIAIVKREGFNISLKYVTAILNSALISYYFTKNTAKAERKLFPKIILNDLRLFPIKEISKEEQQPFITLVDKMLSLNSALQAKRQNFLGLLPDNFTNIKITGSLERFDELEFKQFIDELKKQKINLSLDQQVDWKVFFNKYKQECCDLAQQINETDREIDRLVYELYGLTEEEIEVIENELK